MTKGNDLIVAIIAQASGFVETSTTEVLQNSKEEYNARRSQMINNVTALSLSKMVLAKWRGEGRKCK